MVESVYSVNFTFLLEQSVYSAALADFTASRVFSSRNAIQHAVFTWTKCFFSSFGSFHLVFQRIFKQKLQKCPFSRCSWSEVFNQHEIRSPYSGKIKSSINRLQVSRYLRLVKYCKLHDFSLFFLCHIGRKNSCCIPALHFETLIS